MSAQATSSRTAAARGGVPLDEALQRLVRDFPFAGYLDLGVDAHRSVAQALARRVPPGGRVLDIGCGPADKTAVLAWMGYDCVGVDDFRDPWHQEGNNFERIGRFARAADVPLVRISAPQLPFGDERFDAVMLCDVIEHLHESPRLLLNDALRTLRPGGWLLITVPNALNLKKRAAVLLGHTNFPDFSSFYWTTGAWRSHVREYCWDDLTSLSHYLGLTSARVSGLHAMLGVLPAWARPVYKLASRGLARTRDSLMLIGRKPVRDDVQGSTS